MRAVLLAAFLVLAGCTAPTADTPTETAGPGSADATTPAAERPAIEVQNGTLPADPNATFRRLRAVLEADAAAPQYVEVVADPEDLAVGPTRRVPRFWRLLGVEHEAALEESERRRQENGVTTGAGGIRLYPGDRDPATVEWLLAHEFVHYVQIRRGHDATLAGALNRTTEAAFLRRAVLEGAAVHATDEYVRRHLPEANATRRFYERLHERLPQGSTARYANLAYLAGSRYVADRFARPAAADAVYADPPGTAEQLLHRGDDQPTRLRVTVETDGWRAVGTDRLGEAFLRVALENGVGPERAARAAAGWGNDSLRVFRPAGGGDPGYVWLLRFDGRTDAGDAAGALRETLGSRGERTDRRWRVAGARATLDRPDERLIALAVGPAAFVNATTVTADGGVGVSVG